MTYLWGYWCMSLFPVFAYVSMLIIWIDIYPTVSCSELSNPTNGAVTWTGLTTGPVHLTIPLAGLDNSLHVSVVYISNHFISSVKHYKHIYTYQSHLTSGVSIPSENDITYSTDNGVFMEQKDLYKNIPVWHWSSEYPSGQSQVSGAVQVPPFSQAGSHEANKM